MVALLPAIRTITRLANPIRASQCAKPGDHKGRLQGRPYNGTPTPQPE
jgi:hypothetical protein